MEILSATVYLYAFLDSTGAPVPFINVITQFEGFLHVELPQPYKMRMQILERKIKCTDFIDRMRRVLLDKSEKMDD